MIRLISLLFLLHAITQISCSKTYRAAVLEYSPTYPKGDSIENIYKKSVADYVGYIQEAAEQGVDIIVFPEIGLSGLDFPKTRDEILPYTTQIPSEFDKITPCNQEHSALQLQAISCAAAKNKIYVVINLSESHDCTNEEECADNGLAYYNTNVVFDRNGLIISRYRKVNLFYEPFFNVTKVPDVKSFETDFGVKFGVMICFDIGFKTPAIDLVRQHGIRDFVYPTAWFSQLPFITAIDFHSSWAYSNDVVVLSSGFDNPIGSNGGSGIYVGRTGNIHKFFPKTKTNKMLIADVPKFEYRKDYKLPEVERALKETRNDLLVFKDDLSDFETALIKSRDFKKTLCQGDLCCDFHVDGFKYQDEHYRYRAVVLNGLRDVVVVNMSVQICAVVQCLSEDLQTCGVWKGTDTGIRFNTLSIKGNLTVNDMTAQFPTTVNTQLLPLDYLDFDYKSSSEVTEISLKKQNNEIMTFGIRSRNYANDRFRGIEKEALSKFMANSNPEKNNAKEEL